MLETEYRSPLQAVIMSAMLLALGKERHDHQAQEEWAAKYAKKISQIIDAPEHDDIRSLARAKKYQEATEIVMGLLGDEGTE